MFQESLFPILLPFCMIALKNMFSLHERYKILNVFNSFFSSIEIFAGNFSGIKSNFVSNSVLKKASFAIQQAQSVSTALRTKIKKKFPNKKKCEDSSLSLEPEMNLARHRTVLAVKFSPSDAQSQEFEGKQISEGNSYSTEARFNSPHKSCGKYIMFIIFRIVNSKNEKDTKLHCRSTF